LRVPAGEFLADDVELRGLLGEVLARGLTQYRRILGLVASSLRAAVQSGSVRVAAKPRVRVEVSPRGTIETKFYVALWAGRDGNNGFGLPLKIEVSSEYIIDNAGRIREHRILESRLNGVLAPGDVFSRWVKELTRDEGSDVNKVVAPTMELLKDAIAWVRRK